MEVPAGVCTCGIPKEPDEQPILADAAVVLTCVGDIPLSARDAVRTCSFDDIVPSVIVAVTNRDLVIAALLRRDDNGAGWSEKLENERGRGPRAQGRGPK